MGYSIQFKDGTVGPLEGAKIFSDQAEYPVDYLLLESEDETITVAEVGSVGVTVSFNFEVDDN